MSRLVYIADRREVKAPIYHIEHVVKEGATTLVRTLCGQKSSFRQYSLRIPKEWGEKIGVPCEACFASRAENG